MPVLFVENRFVLGVVEAEGGVGLAAAFDGLLVELVGAALLAVEGGLEVVTQVEEHVDGAAGLSAGGQALAVAVSLKVDGGGGDGEHAPIDEISEGLLLRKAVAGTRRGQRGRLLAGSRGRKRESQKRDGSVCAHLQRGGRLLKRLTL
jgi:hypothetical protein